MGSFIGIVSKESYHLKSNLGGYIVDFFIQVDSKKYRYGEVFVSYNTENLIELNIGDRVYIKGELLQEDLYILEAKSIKRLPLYS